ncbi:hypothetical protein IE4803_PB00464 (plasmid) [Rhizobium etli bv. phaseoli str. IE4803]|nr:hypothetical protein IE4803_PB00464 [Rhizobium etli bv. phaseoli str. IE4803]
MADNPDLLVGQVVHLELFPAVQGLPVLGILAHHLGDELPNRGLVLPAQLLAGLGRITGRRSTSVGRRYRGSTSTRQAPDAES